MITVRAGLWIVGFLGVLWAILGLFRSVTEFGVGVSLAAGSVIGWGLCDWMERNR